MDLYTLGRWLLGIAVMLLLVGLLLLGLGKLTGGRWLPGDIHIENERVRIYIPIVTSIIISLILTLLLNLIFFFIRRGR